MAILQTVISNTTIYYIFSRLLNGNCTNLHLSEIRIPPARPLNQINNYFHTLDANLLTKLLYLQYFLIPPVEKQALVEVDFNRTQNKTTA
jgi:hypothetical protein